MRARWEVAIAVPHGSQPPSKLRSSTLFRITRTGVEQLLRRRVLPPITIVEVAERADPEDVKRIAVTLAGKPAVPRGGGFVIFALEGNPKTLPEWDVELLRPFRKPERVEIARMCDVEERIEALVSKLKIVSERPKAPAAEEEIAPTRSSPLDRVEELIAATKDLRESSGRLSATRVANAFGVSASRLARWLGRSRQAVSKVPDAESLQTPLGYFERIARLRAALGDHADFKCWLRLASPELDGKRPIDLIDDGRWQEVVDLVDDTLTGSPS